MSAQVLNEPCGIIQNERVNCARVRSGGLIPSPYTVMSEERWLRDSTLAPALFALISSSFLPSLRNSFVFRCGRTQPGVRTSAPATLHLICSGRSGASRVIREHVSISVCIPQTLHVWFEWCNLAATGASNLVFFFLWMRLESIAPVLLRIPSNAESPGNQERILQTKVR